MRTMIMGSLRENSLETKSMDSEISPGLMADSTLVFGVIINSMVMLYSKVLEEK